MDFPYGGDPVYRVSLLNCIECFYVNDEPESKFLYIETIKLYCIVLKRLYKI